jgi:large-conductance mechanosensitive channel
METQFFRTLKHPNKNIIDIFLKFCINDLNRFFIIYLFIYLFMDKMNKVKDGRRREKELSREKSKSIL